MYLDAVTTALRTLAKSNYYQTVYSFSKESPVWVFQNRADFSALQLEFLSYVSFYHSLQLDVYMGEIDERVLQNFVYEDAYSIYRNAERKKVKPTLHVSPSHSTKDRIVKQDTWLFKSRKKKT